MEALTKAQPRELEASEIDVRLGATWLDPDIIQKFMTETFQIPYYLRYAVKVRYSPYTAEWRVEGKTATGRGDIISSETYGTSRANAYKILEETLNLKDVRIYDTIEDAEGKPKRVLNKRETMLAQQKQQVIKDAFANWVWQDPQRRIALVKQYNELFNSTRPREYDGSHIKFVGMNPEITLREHQRNAIAHVLYGGNTLLAHEVGAGKTYEMAASAMEAKRLGLCQKSLFVVPNHLTEQWASEFLNLYPNAKLLVARRKDFEQKLFLLFPLFYLWALSVLFLLFPSLQTLELKYVSICFFLCFAQLLQAHHQKHILYPKFSFYLPFFGQFPCVHFLLYLLFLLLQSQFF